MSKNKAHDTPKCGAQTKKGKQCGRPAGWGTPHPGAGRCKLHGGSSTGAKTKEGKQRVSMNALKHGAYVNRLLNEDEQQIYNVLRESTIQKYELDEENPVDMSILHRACMSYIKAMRMDEWEMEEKWIPNEKEKDPETGDHKLRENDVYDREGNVIGKETGRLIRIRWPNKAPSWELHFQKYIQMLGVDRATQQKRKDEQEGSQKVIDAFAFLWGNKSEEIQQ